MLYPIAILYNNEPLNQLTEKQHESRICELSCYSLCKHVYSSCNFTRQGLVRIRLGTLILSQLPPKAKNYEFPKTCLSTYFPWCAALLCAYFVANRRIHSFECHRQQWHCNTPKHDLELQLPQWRTQIRNTTPFPIRLPSSSKYPRSSNYLFVCTGRTSFLAG